MTNSTQDTEGWLPIETAPKDGTVVRLKFGDDEESEADEHGPYEGSWIGGAWWDRTGSDYDYGFAWPTHWQPLPEAKAQQ